MGVDTEKVPGDQLLKAVEEHKSRGYTQVQSVNDLNLVAGYSPYDFYLSTRLYFYYLN